MTEKAKAVVEAKATTASNLQRKMGDKVDKAAVASKRRHTEGSHVSNVTTSAPRPTMECESTEEDVATQEEVITLDGDSHAGTPIAEETSESAEAQLGMLPLLSMTTPV